MSYRCDICLKAVPPGTSRLVHVVYRDVLVNPLLPDSKVRHEIQREIPVCPECKADLGRGATVAELIRLHHSPIKTPANSPTTAEAARGVADRGEGVLDDTPPPPRKYAPPPPATSNQRGKPHSLTSPERRATKAKPIFFKNLPIKRTRKGPPKNGEPPKPKG